MTVLCEWRGVVENAELDRLHAQAFGPRLHPDDERDWDLLLAQHSLGWVVARKDDRLVGFVNVVWDGCKHAWVQDTMVADEARNQGIGTQMILMVRSECRRSGCTWLHADFSEDLRPFYLDSCGFTPTSAGLIRLG